MDGGRLTPSQLSGKVREMEDAVMQGRAEIAQLASSWQRSGPTHRELFRTPVKTSMAHTSSLTERLAEDTRPKSASRGLKQEAISEDETESSESEYAPRQLKLEPLLAREIKGSRSKHAPSHRKPEPDSTESEEEVKPKKGYRRKRRESCALPRFLEYDGKSSWLTFRRKFETLADAEDWTRQQRKDRLCWSLQGKAADYYAVITDREDDLTYSQLMKKLEYRFGMKDLAETAQMEFEQASQRRDENLEDWADRVMTLATRAFRDVPDAYSNKQCINKLCQGLRDEETGHFVWMQSPRTIEDAIDLIKRDQHVRQAVTKKGKRGLSRPEDIVVCAVNESKTDDQLKRMEAMVEEMRNMVREIRTLSVRKTAGGPRPRASVDRDPCHHCGKLGHFIRDCPDAPKRTRKSLNGRGSRK